MSQADFRLEVLSVAALDTAVWLPEIRAMHIETIVVGPYEVNCYILSQKDAAQAVVIDPGAETDVIVQYLRAERLAPAAYLLTHGHVDHIGGLEQMLAVLPAPVYLHADEKNWAFSKRNSLPPFYFPPSTPPADLHVVADGDEFNLAGIPFRVIATPGHTVGGVCYYVEQENALFTGDTLFQGTVGRTDLPGGDGRVLAQSLKKLAVLPSVTRVYPGHGPETSIADERRHNVYFRTPAAL